MTASKTDQMLRAVCGEIKRRREELDATEGLTSLSVFVHLDKQTGRPRQVVSRAEASREIQPGARCMTPIPPPTAYRP